MTIVGLGIDVVDVQRLADALTRTPKLGERLFTDAERSLPTHSLAARVAAKEATAKALGGAGFAWRDAEVVRGDDGRPALHVHGAAARAAAARGVVSWHVSLSHDAGVATAVVIAETAG